MPCYSPALIQIMDYNAPKKFWKYKYLGKADNVSLADYYSLDPDVYDWSHKSTVIVPCGKCIGCRLDYAETWADRALVESFDKPSLFVTVTYNDENLPINDLGFSSISKSDIDDFIVSLRNKFRNSFVRYLCATEYGDEELRCHAHFIVYNVDLEQINPKFYKLNQALSPMYTSDVLSDLWNGKGFVVVEEANYYNMAYTARYILKKQKGEGAAEYDAFHLTPPSFRVSNRPGIGHDWAMNNLEELFTNGFVPVSRDVKGSGKISVNRYFKKICEKEAPELLSKWNNLAQSKYQDIFHDRLRNSSFTLEQVDLYNEFARQSFLKKTNLSRNNFS